jgi:hypothetical protein
MRPELITGGQLGLVIGLLSEKLTRRLVRCNLSVLSDTKAAEVGARLPITSGLFIMRFTFSVSFGQYFSVFNSVFRYIVFGIEYL